MHHTTTRRCNYPLPGGGWCTHLTTGVDCGRHDRHATVTGHPLDRLAPAQAVADTDPFADAPVELTVPERLTWVAPDGVEPPTHVVPGTTWLFDADGTLADVSDARRHIDATHPKWTGTRNYDLFHREGLTAPPHDDVAALARQVDAAGARVVVVTARDDLYGRPTALWCADNDIPFEQVITRRHRDDRPDGEVKTEILAALRDAGHQVAAAVDDNPEVLAVWAAHDIPALRVPGFGPTSDAEQ